MFSVVIPIKKREFQLETIEINSKSLLDKKLENLLHIDMVDEIILASDDEDLTRYSDSKIKFLLRDIKHIDNICYLADNILNIASCEHIAWTPSTTPFIDQKIICDIFEKYLSLNFDIYDSLITCKILQGFILDDNGPINFYTGKKELNSRTLSKLYQIIGGCFIAPKSTIKKYHFQWGAVPYKYIIDKKHSLDIKDKEDFEIYNIIGKDFLI